MFGVSPAWFLSLYGDEFTCKQAADSFTLLRSLGFSAWQPEIFLPERLDEWESSESESLRRKAEENKLTATQFVAHFLLHSFESEEKLKSDWGIGECERLLSVLENWPEIQVVTVPIPPFKTEGTLSVGQFKSSYQRLIEKLTIICGMIEATARRCSLEIIPGAILGGSEGFLSLKKITGLKNLGVNLDTGHFNAIGERLDFTLGRVGAFVTGTHICDNDGIINNSYEPGSGTVLWDALQDWSIHSGYKGSWDIEIRCDADEVQQRYTDGLNFLKTLYN